MLGSILKEVIKSPAVKCNGKGLEFTEDAALFGRGTVEACETTLAGVRDGVGSDEWIVIGVPRLLEWPEYGRAGLADGGETKLIVCSLEVVAEVWIGNGGYLLITFLALPLLEFLLEGYTGGAMKATSRAMNVSIF